VKRHAGAIVRAILLSSPELGALVGPRIYPDPLPQKVTLPAITYLRVYGHSLQSLTGLSGLADPRMQIDSWSKDSDEAEAVAAAVKGWLCGNASHPGWPGRAHGAQGVVFIDDQHLYEPDTGLHRVRADYVVNHEEEVTWL
jgi:hypothetical protein